MASARQNEAAAQVNRPLPLFAHSASGPADAPWITFVPGIGNDRPFWHGQTERLAQNSRVLLFDPWGHGESPAPPENCTF